MAEAQAASDLARLSVEAVTARVEELEEDLAGVRQTLRTRIAAIYKFGDLGQLRLFLSIRPEIDLVPAVRQLRFLVRRDSRWIEEYAAIGLALGRQREALVTEREERDRWLSQMEVRQRQLAEARRRHRDWLAESRDRETSLRQRTEVLRDKEQRLSQLIEALASEQGLPLGGVPIQSYRGVLDWPAEGRVSVGFGPRRDPRYRTTVPHNGIEVAVSGECVVRSVYPGRVVFAASFEGYRKAVVVRHPKGVLTLYAQLEELLVQESDVVALGDSLGRCEGSLYFELRVGSRPEDPLTWLR